MEQSPSWEANSHSSSQEIPHLLWDMKVHYRVCKSPPLARILSQMHPVHTLPPVSLRSILILSCHLRLDLPSGLFPLDFQTEILPAFLISYVCCMLRPSPHTNNTWWRVQVMKLLIMQSSPTSHLFHLGPNILLSTLFPNNLSLFSLSMRDQVSHPYETAGKIIVLYIFRL